MTEQAPSTNIQAPEKLQAPSSPNRSSAFRGEGKRLWSDRTPEALDKRRRNSRLTCNRLVAYYHVRWMQYSKPWRMRAAARCWTNCSRTTVRRSVNCAGTSTSVSYTHLRAHETRHDLVCRL